MTMSCCRCRYRRRVVVVFVVMVTAAVVRRRSRIIVVVLALVRSFARPPARSVGRQDDDDDDAAARRQQYQRKQRETAAARGYAMLGGKRVPVAFLTQRQRQQAGLKNVFEVADQLSRDRLLVRVACGVGVGVQGGGRGRAERGINVHRGGIVQAQCRQAGRQARGQGRQPGFQPGRWVYDFELNNTGPRTLIADRRVDGLRVLAHSLRLHPLCPRSTGFGTAARVIGWLL
jgi:hypothetical protein